MEEVVVTGSRIKMANLEGTSPVTQVTSADIATQGVTRVEDLINQLPQAFAAQNANVANGATGTATVNLRGLGSARTLVLVDGRRMPYGGVTNSAADLNQIPAAMVERVEILTGGASAVYGSDAIGGVVNFIMKKDFEGVQFDAQYGIYQHDNDFGGPGAVELRDVIKGRAATNPAQFKLPGSYVTDGDSTEFNVLMGVNSEDGRGNLTAYAGVPRQRRSAAGRPRLLGLLAQPDQQYRARRSLAAVRRRATRATSITQRRRSFTIDSDDRQHVPAVQCRYRRVQLRPAQPLPASRPRYSLGAMGHYELDRHSPTSTRS